MVEFVAEGNLMYVGVGWFVFMVQIYSNCGKEDDEMESLTLCGLVCT